jgi:transposase
MDLGDKRHVVVVFGEDGKEERVDTITNTARQVRQWFGRHAGAVVVMEAGTHSPWISRLLTELGHDVHVGNPRKLRAIWDADDKSDERDARILGLMYRLEPRLLHRIFHRGEKVQADVERIKARNVLVQCRTTLINHVRAAVKGIGERIPACSSASFHKRARKQLPELLKGALEPLLQAVEDLSVRIDELDAEITRLCEQDYPQTHYLRQVPGVGPITALAYVLTLEDPGRFAKSRSVGAFLGMVPRRDQSGETDKQLRITKAGNRYLRQLLVACSHYILGRFGPDSDLRRHGLALAARGGKNAKKRAVVATARRLAVLLHRLWVDQAEYVALRQGTAVAA